MKPRDFNVPSPLLMMWVVVVVLAAVVYSYPEGAPNTPDTCLAMLPGHPDTSPQTLPPPFDIIVNSDKFSAGDTLTVTIRMKGSELFKGFFIQARLADTSLGNPEPIGHFKAAPGTKIICSGPNGNALTHVAGSPGSSDLKPVMAVEWTAPSSSRGHVEFRVTLVLSLDRYWVQERSKMIVDKQTPLPKHLATTPSAVPEQISTETCGQARGKGCYRNPPGCHADTCDILATWSESGDYVDFQLTADTEGWVAIGFSEDKKMGKDDVWECVYGNSSRDAEVVVRRSRNEDSKRNVPVDSLGLRNKFGVLSNGRLSCYFRQDKKASGGQKPLFFDQRSHVFLAKGRVDDKGNKRRHTLEANKYPYVSTQKVSAYDRVDMTHTARYPLVKAHGCLMLVAWMMCASTALIMAKYYKPMWPNETLCNGRVWFAVHAGCMVTCLFCTIAAFIIIFIHTYGYSQMPEYPDKAHPPLGICTTILCVLNPILALFRCSEKSKWRPIFNWFHWLFGTCAAVLATPTIFIGLNLPKSHVPWWATWVMVAFMLFHLIIELMLEIHGCLNAKKQKSRNQEYEKRLIKGEYEPEPVGTRFKKIILTLYLIVVICLGIVMVIAVAAG